MTNVGRGAHPRNRERVCSPCPLGTPWPARHVRHRSGPACDACGHEWDARHGADHCPLCDADAHPDHDAEEVPWGDSAFVAIGRE